MWFWSTMGLAATTQVTPGEDWCRVVDRASPGDEIVLDPGEHAGPCVISVSGTPTAPVVIRGDGASILYNGTSSNVIDVYGSHLEFRSLRFAATRTDIDALKVRTTDDVRVTGCTFEDIGGISISANSGDTTGLQILDNTFRDLRATGIYVGCHDGECASKDVLIRGNLIDGVTSASVGYGLQIKVDSQARVADNVIHNTQGPAIHVYGAHDQNTISEVDGNLLVGSRQEATLEVGGGPVRARNNIVIGGSSAAVLVYDYGGRGLDWDIQIEGNTIIGEGGPAVAVSLDNVQLRNNAAWQRSGGGPALPLRFREANVVCDADCFVSPSAWDYSPAKPDLLPGLASENTTDFCGASRSEQPLAGALEVSSGSLGVFPKAAFDCAPGDDGADTGGPVEEQEERWEASHGNQDPPPVHGCSCDGGASRPSALVTGLLLLLLVRRRQP